MGHAESEEPAKKPVLRYPRPGDVPRSVDVQEMAFHVGADAGNRFALVEAASGRDFVVRSEELRPVLLFWIRSHPLRRIVGEVPSLFRIRLDEDLGPASSRAWVHLWSNQLNSVIDRHLAEAHSERQLLPLDVRGKPSTSSSALHVTNKSVANPRTTEMEPALQPSPNSRMRVSIPLNVRVSASTQLRMTSVLAVDSFALPSLETPHHADRDCWASSSSSSIRHATV